MKKYLIAFVLVFLSAVSAYADSTIPNLSAGTTITDADLFVASQGGNPAANVPASAIKTYIGTGVSGVASIQGSTFIGTGAFSVNNGLSTNTQWFSSIVAPWSPFKTNSNILAAPTGPRNLLRNSSMTSFQHNKFMTGDSTSTPYKLGIANFTAIIDNGS